MSKIPKTVKGSASIASKNPTARLRQSEEVLERQRREERKGHLQGFEIALKSERNRLPIDPVPFDWRWRGVRRNLKVSESTE